MSKYSKGIDFPSWIIARAHDKDFQELTLGPSDKGFVTLQKVLAAVCAAAFVCVVWAHTL